MTQEDFKKKCWNSMMKCIYKGAEYNIVSVNFYEYLVELECGEDDQIWVRCENITLIENNQTEKDDAIRTYCDNPQLIEAINAIREETDYNQWFTDGRYWMICKYDEIAIGFIDQQNAGWLEFPHKATVKELIAKFTRN